MPTEGLVEQEKPTITLERYEAALAGAEPVTYHKAGCPSVLTLGWDPCSPDAKICGALVEHQRKLGR